MANDNVQAVVATPKLALELEALHERVRRMESLMRGAETVLNTRYDGDLSYTPAAENNVQAHRRAFDLVQFLAEQFEAWRQSEEDLDFASDDISALADKAREGRLIRYGKLVPEPA